MANERASERAVCEEVRPRERKGEKGREREARAGRERE